MLDLVKQAGLLGLLYKGDQLAGPFGGVETVGLGIHDGVDMGTEIRGAAGGPGFGDERSPGFQFFKGFLEHLPAGKAVLVLGADRGPFHGRQVFGDKGRCIAVMIGGVDRSGRSV